MANLNLTTVELVSTLRAAPLNGPTNSQDYNDSFTETLADLASLSGFINDIVIPMLNGLSSTIQPLNVTTPSGLEGRFIFSDTSDLTPVFFDSLSGQSLTIAESLRVLNGIVSAVQTTIGNLNVEVTALQTQLSATNQNDLAQALQNITTTITNLTNQVNALSQLINSPPATFGASGPSHATGDVPDPGPVAGIVRYLREDATWDEPPGTGGGNVPIVSDHPNLTVSLGPITLATPSVGGTYRVSIYEECNIAGASGGGSPFGNGVFGSGTFNIADDNVQTVVSWTDDVGVRNATPIPTPLDLGNTNAASGDIFIRVVGGQPITFQTFLAATGAPTYSVFVRMEPLD